MTTFNKKNECESLIVSIKDSADHKIYIDLSPLLSLGRNLANEITKCLVQYCSSYSSLSAATRLRSLLKQMGYFFAERPADLKNEKSLYSFLFDFRNHWYTTNTISQRLDIRNGFWDVFIQFLEYLMNKGIIAIVPIPPGNPKLHNKDILKKNEFSGGNDQCISSLVPICIAKTDDEYLDELHTQFKSACNTLLNCAKKEIEIIIKDLNVGNEMIDSVNYSELTKIITDTFTTKKPYSIKKSEYKEIIDDESKKSKRGEYIKIFGPHNKDGYKQVLSYIKNKHDGFFITNNNKSDPALYSLRRMIPSPKTLGNHLGLLTTRKAVPFFVYLLLKNPKFTVDALINVNVDGPNGIRTFLSTAGDGPEIVRMKVKKGRAKAEKSELLDDEAKTVLQILLRITDPLRIFLKKQGHTGFNNLWLCGGGSGCEFPYKISMDSLRMHFGQKAYREDLESLSQNVRGMTNRSFLSSHPELSPYIRTANLTRLRTTAGLLVWFESGGDAKAVARALGNSVNVSVDHYIPKPLQTLMNMRLIRRFQNLLIIAATAGEPFMLQATDFQTQEELHSFLFQMLGDGRASGNELLQELQCKINKSNKEVVNADEDEPGKNKQIALNISDGTLAVLFLYEEHLQTIAPSAKVHVDQNTNTSPVFWSKLAGFIHSAMQNEPSFKHLNSIYKKALQNIETMRPLIKFPDIVALRYDN